uniref:Uncharacterized protein n=1 Tax=Panagrolaimus sp. PS1159 TaxID=55785 RepID=A0AC35GSW1_9BILA
MPWCTLKCSKETLDRIKFTLGVFHVPSLVLLDENNEIITRNGRWLISSDQNCEKFNWNQWKWDALNPIQWNSIRPWNFYILWEMPSLIVFGDSDDETYIDEWIESVGQMQFTNVQNHYIKTKKLQLNGKNLTKNQFINGSAFLLFKCIDDDEFLIHYDLADLGVPLAVIFDPFIGVTICEEEAMSAEILTKFLDNYLKGKIVPTIAAIPKFTSNTVIENVTPQENKPILLGETNDEDDSK